MNECLTLGNAVTLFLVLGFAIVLVESRVEHLVELVKALRK